MLPDPGRGQEDPLGLLLGPLTFGGGLRDLVLEGVLQGGGSELVLAEKGELTAVLESEEVGQPVFAYAFVSGRVQQHAIDVGEMRGLISKHGTGQDVILAAVRAGAVQIGHLGEHARGRPRRIAGRGEDRFRRPVRGGTAEAPVVDQERSGQAQQRLDWQEYDLPTRRDRGPPPELAKLLPSLTSGQVQEIGELSHTARLLLA